MSTFPNSLQKPERFDLYVRKFRATCVMHGIQLGSRDDLSGFMQKLVEDRFFAMDFWKLVGKLSDREGGELSDDQMLAVVVEGVTGGEVPEDDGEARKTIEDLRAMLAGVDVQGLEQNQVVLAPFPRTEPEPWQQGGGRTGIHAVEPALKLTDSREAFLAETMRAQAKPTTEPSEADLPELTEEHLRQELTRLLERYLESVNRSKKRPLAEDAAPAEVAEEATTARSFEEPVQEVADDLAYTPTGSSRLVLEPDVPATESSLLPTHDSPLLRFTLDDHSSSSGYGKVILYLVLVLALFGAGFEGYLHRVPLLEKLSFLRQNFERRTSTTASAGETTPPVSSEADSSALQPAQDQQSPPPSSPSVTAAPSQANVTAGGAPGQIAPASSRDDRTTLPPEQVPENLISSADLVGTVQVPAEAMEAYLVASRVPAYPEAAKAEGVQGSVEMQVIIAKDGTVKRVHVIRGDSRLRVAAAEAVYRWKYRPYLVDGEPVEVATIITVDFDLD